MLELWYRGIVTRADIRVAAALDLGVKDEVQDLAPAPRQHLEIAALEHKGAETTLPCRDLLSAWDVQDRHT